MTKTIKEEGKYGDAVNPKEAPETISKVVASLAPEAMFELMKEMKACVQNNPHEARNMLLQNPQLAYALLQAQAGMRIVDPDIAMKMLHRQAPVQPLLSTGGSTRTLGGSERKLRQLESHINHTQEPSSRSASTASRPPAAQPRKTEVKQDAINKMSGTDREKAQLIMQVMNLTTEQINMLPLEQRKSILELRSQLANQSK